MIGDFLREFFKDEAEHSYPSQRRVCPRKRKIFQQKREAFDVVAEPPFCSSS
jgi:hypothetical protein